ncbi:MAG: hypothetical protein ACRYGF_06390 [Janthinobacterium lividum]
MKAEQASREAEVAEWKRLTEKVLPALAKQHRWPLQLDHCFKRVCLDFAFQDVWYRHVQKPAERHMGADALARAIGCALEIVHCGESLLRERNEESLRYRGKGKYKPQ